MVNIVKQKTIGPDGLTYYFFTGESTDTKPTGEYPEDSGLYVAESSEFYELDTGTRYSYNGDDYVGETGSYNARIMPDKNGMLNTRLTVIDKIPKGTKSIARECFYENRYLRGTLEIPEEVQYIGKYAFRATKLKKIIFRGSPSTLEDNIFESCKNLEVAILPKQLTEIPSAMFYSCYNLKRINIPDGVTAIHGTAFNGCYNCEFEGLDFSKLTYVGDFSFTNCKKLSVFADLSNVTNEYQHYAFAASAITGVKFPISSNWKTVSQYMFGSCYNLKTVDIPNNVTYLQTRCFYDCKNLKSVEIGSGITKIDSDVFTGCTSLETITINKPEGSVAGAPWGAPETTQIIWTG